MSGKFGNLIGAIDEGKSRYLIDIYCLFNCDNDKVSLKLN